MAGLIGVGSSPRRDAPVSGLDGGNAGRGPSHSITGKTTVGRSSDRLLSFDGSRREGGERWGETSTFIRSLFRTIFQPKDAKVCPMELSAFAFEIKDGVAHITMNQPERGNPLDSRFAEEFNWLATECTVRPGVRSVLIDAAGRFFSVGGDLNALTRSREDLARFVSIATSDLHMGISRFARMNAPIIIAVHGMAAGGAVALVAGADFALASPNAKFFAAFSGIGIISDSGGSYFLPRRMGSRRAAQFLMLNETLTAAEAADAGLINRVVEAEALPAEAWALAARLAQGPTLAYGEAKNLLLSSQIESLEAQLENEARAMARVTATEDAWDAMCAVLAKQKPTFQGR